MSQTTTPDGPGHREEEPIRHDAASEPGPAADRSPSPPRRAPVAALVVSSVLCLIALALVSGGAFGLWKDVVARDSQGFVTLGSTELQTPQYAIVGDLQGDGPGWLYGSSALGDVRVRATSQTGQPVFIGIARQDDLRSYLRGVGYATVYSFEVSADTTHEGEAPSGPPSDESIWAVSTEGTGQQALQWTPQAGDWSVVFMNSDGGADVDVRGDARARCQEASAAEGPASRGPGNTRKGQQTPAGRGPDRHGHPPPHDRRARRERGEGHGALQESPGEVRRALQRW